MTMTEAERIEHLKMLGLSPDGATAAPVAAQVAANTPTAPAVAAPSGVDLRTIPVDQIVFDPALIAHLPNLDFGDGGKVAYDLYFQMYKSLHRNKERHSLLGQRITSFITAERRRRIPGMEGLVHDKIVTTKQQRDHAAVLAHHEAEPADVSEALRIRAALIKAGIDVNTLLNPEA